jgi:hypothetical protein
MFGRPKGGIDMAKFLLSWTFRSGGSAQQTHEDGKKLLDVFAKWSPPADETFHEFLARIDGQGGYAVISTDNVNGIAEGLAPFTPWLDYQLVPVMEIADGVAIVAAAAQMRDSI